MRGFHYTDERAYNQIRRTRRFRQSTRFTSMDAAYGNGWYFTDLPPSTDDTTIMQTCWRGGVNPTRLGYYLEFEIDPALATRTGVHTFVVKKWDSGRIRLVGGGPRPHVRTPEESRPRLQFRDWPARRRVEYI